jgi:multisubunit Na+/H+ antiporter MnhB subunit
MAWERTALGVLAAAVLLLFRHVGPTLARTLLVVLDVGVGLVMIWFGRRRGRQIWALRADPDASTAVPDARVEVVGAAVAGAVIAVGTALVLMFQR